MQNGPSNAMSEARDIFQVSFSLRCKVFAEAAGRGEFYTRKKTIHTNSYRTGGMAVIFTTQKVLFS